MLKTYTQLYFACIPIYNEFTKYANQKEIELFKLFLVEIKLEMDMERSNSAFFEKETKSELTKILKFNNVFDEINAKFQQFKTGWVLVNCNGMKPN